MLEDVITHSIGGLKSNWDRIILDGIANSGMVSDEKGAESDLLRMMNESGSAGLELERAKIRRIGEVQN